MRSNTPRGEAQRQALFYNFTAGRYARFNVIDFAGPLVNSACHALGLRKASGRGATGRPSGCDHRGGSELPAADCDTVPALARVPSVRSLARARPRRSWRWQIRRLRDSRAGRLARPSCPATVWQSTSRGMLGRLTLYSMVARQALASARAECELAVKKELPRFYPGAACNEIDLKSAKLC